MSVFKAQRVIDQIRGQNRMPTSLSGAREASPTLQAWKAGASRFDYPTHLLLYHSKHNYH